MNVSVLKKVNMFTTAKNTEIPVLEWIGSGFSIPSAADFIAKIHENEKVPQNTYFLIKH